MLNFSIFIWRIKFTKKKQRDCQIYVIENKGIKTQEKYSDKKQDKIENKLKEITNKK
jgi:hypothetical protein